MTTKSNIILFASALLPLLTTKLGSVNRANRVRVNFNLNRSQFGGNPSERYYQYGIRNTKNTVQHYAEQVCLVNVSIWCSVTRFRRFEERKEQGIAKGYTGQQFAKWMQGVLKDPFCYLEGDLVDFDTFQSMLSQDGLKVTDPSGIASFNPRDKNQVASFLFSPMDRLIDKSEWPVIIGAKYVLCTNGASPFPPCYVWKPCLIQKSQFKIGLPGYTKTKFDSYKLYTELIPQGKYNCWSGFAYKQTAVPKQWIETEDLRSFI